MPPLRHRLRRHALDPFRPIEKLKPEHRRRAVVEVVVDHRRFGIEPEHHRRAVQRSSRVATAYSARACQMTKDNDRVPGRAVVVDVDDDPVLLAGLSTDLELED